MCGIILKNTNFNINEEHILYITICSALYIVNTTPSPMAADREEHEEQAIPAVSLGPQDSTVFQWMGVEEATGRQRPRGTDTSRSVTAQLRGERLV